MSLDELEYRLMADLEDDTEDDEGYKVCPNCKEPLEDCCCDDDQDDDEDPF